MVGLDGTVRTRRGRRDGALDDVDLDGVDGEAPAARNVTIFLLGGFAAAHEENTNLPERISSDMLACCCYFLSAPQPSLRRRRTRSRSCAAETALREDARAGTSEPTDRRTDERLYLCR